jgi:hypothetical protein
MMCHDVSFEVVVLQYGFSIDFFPTTHVVLLISLMYVNTTSITIKSTIKSKNE